MTLCRIGGRTVVVGGGDVRALLFFLRHKCGPAGRVVVIPIGQDLRANFFLLLIKAHQIHPTHE